MAKWYNTGKTKIGYAYVPPVKNLVTGDAYWLQTILLKDKEKQERKNSGPQSLGDVLSKIVSRLRRQKGAR